MKKFIAAALCALIMACNTQKPAADSGSIKLVTKKDSISYAIGMSTGQNMKKQKIDADPAMVAAAIKEAYSGGKYLFTDEQLTAELQVLQQDIVTARENESKEFFENNKKKDGVVTTASGLQYKIITPGNGPKPKNGQHISVNYVLKFIDGTEFDSSVKRGQPGELEVGKVFPGWNEALMMMPVGAKWELYIPSELAYGARGYGMIPPNSPIVLECELLKAQ